MTSGWPILFSSCFVLLPALVCKLCYAMFQFVVLSRVWFVLNCAVLRCMCLLTPSVHCTAVLVFHLPIRTLLVQFTLAAFCQFRSYCLVLHFLSRLLLAMPFYFCGLIFFTVMFFLSAIVKLLFINYFMVCVFLLIALCCNI